LAIEKVAEGTNSQVAEKSSAMYATDNLIIEAVCPEDAYQKAGLFFST
jgi:hypothetical protein